MSTLDIEWSKEGLQALTIPELRRLNVFIGLKGYSGKNKQELIDLLLTRPPSSVMLPKSGSTTVRYRFFQPTSGVQSGPELLVVILYQGQVLLYSIPITSATLDLVQELAAHNPEAPLALETAGRLVPYHVPSRLIDRAQIVNVMNFFI